MSDSLYNIGLYLSIILVILLTMMGTGEVKAKNLPLSKCNDMLYGVDYTIQKQYEPICKKVWRKETKSIIKSFAY